MIDTVLARTAVIAALLSIPTISASAASEGAATAIRIQGNVPTICRVTFARPVVTLRDGSADLGPMEEMCNSSGGYRIVVRHGEVADGTRLIVDDRTVPLTGTETVLVDSDGPALHIRTIRFASAGPGASPSLVFRAEAKGPVY